MVRYPVVPTEEFDAELEPMRVIRPSPRSASNSPLLQIYYVAHEDLVRVPDLWVQIPHILPGEPSCYT